MPTALQIVEHYEQSDPEAALMLVELAAYDVLCDVLAVDGAQIAKSMAAEIITKNDNVRRELVRKFIDARLNQAAVEPLLEAAAHLTMIDFEVAKAAHGDNKNTSWWDKTDEHGRFAPRNGSGGAVQADRYQPSANAQRRLDMLAALTGTPDENRNGWKGQGKEWNSDNRYGRASRVGQALSLSQAPGAQAGAIAASLYGAIGPEAEEVLGRSLRRSAYRYRGTERRPSIELRTQTDESKKIMRQVLSQDVNQRQAGVKAISDEDPSAVRGQNFDGERRPQAVGGPVTRIARFNLKREAESTDQRFLRTQADMTTNYLIEKIPSLANAELSMAAGKTPPSQGVMLDRDGDVVSQAVGYNGDHYLPFDLKNLKQLHGGQYVRTRVQGGPTTEDIYTGLLTGARQMTIVSNAGVFTMEFDPDLRGGRRYSDKAHQMIGRYAEMLGAIKSDSGVTVGDIKPEEKAKLREQALLEADNDPVKANEIYTKDLLPNAKRLALFSADDDDDLEGRAKAMAEKESHDAHQAGKPGYSTQDLVRRSRELQGELKREAADDRLRKLKLDGPGYHRAMLALKEEFPFYIRDATFVPLERWQNERGLVDPQAGRTPRPSIRGIDRGYVAENELAFGHSGEHGQGRRTEGGLRLKAAAEKKTKEGETEGTEGASGGSGSTTSSKYVEQPFNKARLNEAAEQQAATALQKLRKNSGLFAVKTGWNGQSLDKCVDDPYLLTKYLEVNNVIHIDKLDPEFSKLNPQQQESMISKLDSLGGWIMDKPAEEEQDAMAEGKKLAAILRIRKPFQTLEGETAAKYTGDLPLGFRDVEKLGLSPHAYDQFLVEQRKNTLAAVINQAGNAASAKTTAHKAARDYDDLENQYGKDSDSKTLKAARDKAEAAQKAWAFLHGKELAAAHGRGDIPKGGASQSGAKQPELVDAAKSLSQSEERLQLLGQVLQSRFGPTIRT